MTSKKLFYVLIGASAILIVAFGFGVNTGLSKLSQERTEISTLLAKLDASEEKLTLTVKTQIQLDQLGFIQTIADEVLPGDKAQPELLGQILLIADKNDITISSITFSTQGELKGEDVPDITQAEPLPNVPGVYTLPLTIKIAGDYDDMLGMLRSVEQNRRKIQTRSVNIRPVLDETGNPTQRVTADIVVDVYVRPAS